MNHLNHTRDILRRLIAYPTISAASNLQMIEFLAEYLDHLGADVLLNHSPDGKKANLFATLGHRHENGVLLSGHTDVVPVADQDWSNAPFDMIERDGRFYGRGTCDMKGFIAACLTKAHDYAKLPLKTPVHFAFTYDEETGCIGAQGLAKWLQEQGITPRIAIIGEPTGMKAIEGHKGCCEYTTHFHGKAGHGSMPNIGLNAVEYALRYGTKLMDIAQNLQGRAPDKSRFDPPWTTLNIGRIRGGHIHNVIPENCSMDWEFRPVQDTDFTYVKETIETYVNETLRPDMQRRDPNANITTEIVGEVVGLEPTDKNEARDIVFELTGQNYADVVPFGTEAGIFAALGMSVVVCGPGSIEQAHKPDEFIELSQLDACLSFLTKLEGKLVA
jgi:acetylornithine deacetylase